jgi:hypothetical protein
VTAPEPPLEIYVVTWSYETYVQDMTPQEAAELAASVFLDGGDPAAPRGHVEMSVSHWDGSNEVPLGEFQVRIAARPIGEPI